LREDKEKTGSRYVLHASVIERASPYSKPRGKRDCVFPAETEISPCLSALSGKGEKDCIPLTHFLRKRRGR